ncbi:MAG: cupin domain-containing protein [Desulfobacterales bacterium]|nr:cupin domain-containing protein [Desulfobacterales bacterium]
MLAYFKKDPFIPVHTPQVDLILYILEGQAEVIAGDDRVTAAEGDLIMIPKGRKEGSRP